MNPLCIVELYLIYCNYLDNTYLYAFVITEVFLHFHTTSINELED